MCKYSALLVLLQFLSAFPLLTNGWVSENRRIEQEVLRNYDRRHRPVKSESTIVKVQLFLTINHVEKVDELEGTMLLHGILWASWNDENLRWSPAEHNNTQVISMETWKIWQPTFALYNSARSNNWFIYLNGVPATVSSEGRVFAAGTFTFQVTCQFDFSDYPYDVQECPIVLADWMFDLSKVNLSEAVSNRPGAPNNLAKPALRLSFDPLSENTKRHVAGWEVLDTWQRLCYWGPNGYCIDKNPIGPLDNYWSLIEFGVRIKRHAPYYGLTLVLPIFITIFLTLLVFWVDNLPLAIFLCVFNLLLESYSGLGLTQQLPPGDGVLPTIGVIHLWNVSLTLLALVVHSLFNFLLQVLPPDTKFLPEQLTNFTAQLRQFKFFRTRGLSLSFDPQTMIGFESPLGNHIGYSGLEEEDLSLTDQPSPDSMIIEMDTVAAGAAVESAPAASNSQFQAIQLGTEGQSSSQTSDESLPSKKSLFGNMFSQRKQKPKKISSPFSSLFGSQNMIVKKSETNSTTEMNTDEAQLLVHVGPAEEEKAEDDERGSQPRIKEAKGENEEEADSRRRQAGTGGAKNGGGGGENGNGNGHGPKEVEQSPLEQELQALRRILFGFVLLASAILILMLIF